jgi:hypothetical protein
MRSSFSLLSLVAVFSASGCAATRWSVVDARPLMAITVAPVEMHGAVDVVLVEQRRATMIGDLRAHGYQVLDFASPGVPTLTMKVEGTLIDDSKLHAPDDSRHHIINDLHYQFVEYAVHVDLVDGGGRTVVCGRASANNDPATAVADLTARLERDVPAAPSTYATR